MLTFGALNHFVYRNSKFVKIKCQKQSLKQVWIVAQPLLFFILTLLVVNSLFCFVIQIFNTFCTLLKNSLEQLITNKIAYRFLNMKKSHYDKQLKDIKEIDFKSRTTCSFEKMLKIIRSLRKNERKHFLFRTQNYFFYQSIIGWLVKLEFWKTLNLTIKAK